MRTGRRHVGTCRSVIVLQTVRRCGPPAKGKSRRFKTVGVRRTGGTRTRGTTHIYQGGTAGDFSPWGREGV